jgi:hypothetical protein
VGALFSSRWVELAILAPGLSHYWSFRPPLVGEGWVFQAAAYPEMAYSSKVASYDVAKHAARLDVTELFIDLPASHGSGAISPIQVNITVTNSGSMWACYSLWVVPIPARLKSAKAAKIRRRVEVQPKQPFNILLINDELGRIKSAGIPSRERDLCARLRPRDAEIITELSSPPFNAEQLRRDPSWISDTYRLDTATAKLVANK